MILLCEMAAHDVAEAGATQVGVHVIMVDCDVTVKEESKGLL